METIWIVVASLLAVFLFILIIVGVYLLIILRKANIIAQKVDYLVEDLTYKVEALTPTVDVINKVSNYALALDATLNKSTLQFFKILKNNQSSLIKLFHNVLSSFNTIWENRTSKKSKTNPKESSVSLDEEDIDIFSNIDEDDYLNNSSSQNSNTDTYNQEMKKETNSTEEKINHKKDPSKSKGDKKNL